MECKCVCRQDFTIVTRLATSVLAMERSLHQARRLLCSLAEAVGDQSLSSSSKSVAYSGGEAVPKTQNFPGILHPLHGCAL